MNNTARRSTVYEDDRVITFQSAVLNSKAEVEMAARSDMYALLADVFRYPDQEFLTFVRRGGLTAALRDIAAKLPVPSALDEEEPNRFNFSDVFSNDDVEAGFIRLFEAGPGDPPCPLVEGKYVKDTNRRAIFEDLIRFYNHFGLSYQEGSHEDRPDHISYELEFMHYLAFLTLGAVQEQKEIADYLAAQSDFLKHHLRKWTGALAERIETIAGELAGEDEVVRFYGNLLKLLDRYITADYGYLKETLEQAARS